MGRLTAALGRLGRTRFPCVPLVLLPVELKPDALYLRAARSDDTRVAASGIERGPNGDIRAWLTDGVTVHAERTKDR